MRRVTQPFSPISVRLSTVEKGGKEKRESEDTVNIESVSATGQRGKKKAKKAKTKTVFLGVKSFSFVSCFSSFTFWAAKPDDDDDQ